MDIIKNRRKLSQTIQRHGVDFTVRRAEKNAFNEPTNNLLPVMEGRGIFHTSSRYISVSGQAHGLVQSVQEPRLMLVFPVTAELQIGDLVELPGCKYRITGTDNLSRLNIALDVSLEVI